ncbi:hypothetical protein [Halomontanus rarus]|uniref:hypothetical protein n=1 Tax=Halomontanus rarus TaxID=3034020 RepID=UPI00307BAAD1
MISSRASVDSASGAGDGEAEDEDEDEPASESDVDDEPFDDRSIRTHSRPMT